MVAWRGLCRCSEFVCLLLLLLATKPRISHRRLCISFARLPPLRLPETTVISIATRHRGTRGISGGRAPKSRLPPHCSRLSRPEYADHHPPLWAPDPAFLNIDSRTELSQ